jgi:hypothetical protein
MTRAYVIPDARSAIGNPGAKTPIVWIPVFRGNDHPNIRRLIFLWIASLRSQ